MVRLPLFPPPPTPQIDQPHDQPQPEDHVELNAVVHDGDEGQPVQDQQAADAFLIAGDDQSHFEGLGMASPTTISKSSYLSARPVEEPSRP